MSRFKPSANRSWSFRLGWCLPLALVLLATGCGLSDYEKALSETTREQRQVANKAAAEAKKEADKVAAAQAAARGRPAPPPAPVAPPPMAQPPVAQPPAAAPAAAPPAQPQ